MNIQSFIHKNYEIAFQSIEIAPDFSNIKEFLLYGSDTWHTVNSLFINTFAKEQDLVLLPEVPSGQIVEKEQVITAIWLDTKAKLIGYDIGDEQKLYGKSWIFDLYSGFKKIHVLMKQYFLAKEEEQKNIFLKKAEDHWKEILPLCFKKRSQYLFNWQLQNEIDAFLNSTRNDRVSSMQSFLEKNQSGSKVFLIGDPTLLDKNLNPHFFSFLKKRKVVVLIPKEEQQIEKEKEEFFQLIYKSIPEEKILEMIQNL